MCLLFFACSCYVLPSEYMTLHHDIIRIDGQLFSLFGLMIVHATGNNPTRLLAFLIQYLFGLHSCSEVALSSTFSWKLLLFAFIFYFTYTAYIYIYIDACVCVCVYVCVCTCTSNYPTPTMSIFKRSLRGLNSEFSFSQTSFLTKVKEPNLLYYLPVARERIFGCIPFQKVLLLCEMKKTSSRI